jgi:PKD repeat protein
MRFPHIRLLASLLIALLGAIALAAPVHAIEVIDPGTQAWGAPAGTSPCASEDLLERRLAEDPTLQARLDLFEQLVRQAERQGLVPERSGRASTSSTPIYVIPIAVHIVHQGGAENISDLQVQSQIYALNRDFANQLNNGAPAVNTGIQFCLATQLPPGSPVVWSTTPGITRDNSPETNHTYGSLASETALKAISYLPAANYLNIWVVKTISGGGGGVAGYATFPGLSPPSRDGIVMRYDCFGSNFTPYGGPYSLLPSNPDGKILTHEAGHYLNILHTFHNGCAPPGDQVSDTPPEQVNRTGCPSPAPTSCTAAPDPIENFMDYTNDACRYAFTAGQTTRMHTAISAYRAMLVSASNLAAAGCSSGLNALIVANPTQLCAGGTVQFSTPASGAGYTYAWSFPGGAPSSASTQNASSNYAVAGTYIVTLTVTDGGSNFSTNTATIYVNACSPIQNSCTNWVFGSGCALSFATGVPVAFGGTLNGSPEPAAMISNASGNLLCYCDGVKVYTNTNAVMPNGNGLLAGISSHNGAIFVPRPGSSTQYFLFTIRNWEDGPTANPVNYSVIDMTLNGGLGDIPAGQKNLLVSLPGNPTTMVEGQALIPHCDGTDWWYILNGDGTSSGKIFVTLVTAAGPTTTTVYPIGMTVSGAPAGAITPTPDGTRIAMANLSSQQIAAYDFDRATGVVSTVLAPTAVGAWADVALSPNGKLLYYSYYISSVYGVRQLNLATMQTRDILANDPCGIKPGPDGKLYLGSGNSPTIHCINFPDSFNNLNLNECGLNKNSIAMPSGAADAWLGALPNMVLQCNGATMPAQFTYTVTNCTTVSFHAVNCSGPYSWNFGDANNGSGQNVVHTYASPGVYTVTCSITGASPSLATQTLTLQLQPVSIAGSNTACANPSNYSAVGPPNYTYTWTVSGGPPATATGNNIDVTWGAGGGTVTLVATDSTTGCTTTLVKSVGPCPVCMPAPPNMSAWYPLDEPSGATAFETVLGDNATDMNAPVHSTGKVKGARQCNGSTSYLQANDGPGINFGTGDLTIDAWVRTTQGTGIQGIVDKRYPDPESGYGLYLKSGRLAFRLADPSTFNGTEYWTNTTPYIADGQWHHVAAVERRSATSNGTRLFVDGLPVASFPAFSATGNVTNTEKLLLGARASFSGPQQNLSGDLDEVEMFQRSLNASEILGIYQADSLGKCREFLYVPVGASLCRDGTEVTLTMKVCNYTTSSQSYNVTFAGLPVGPGCTYSGPTSFQLLTSNPIVVPANSCVSVPYKVFRPAGMPVYATSCYKVTATNIVSNAQSISGGSITVTRLWCVSGVIAVDWGHVGSSTAMKFSLSNTSTTPLTANYTARVVPLPGDDASEPSGISLNGLAPDFAYTGSVDVAAGDAAEVDIDAAFTQSRGFRAYDVVLSLDEDGDGVDDATASALLRYAENPAPTVSTPTRSSPPRALALSVAPNPLRNSALLQYMLPDRAIVEVGLYDIVGRRVRTLIKGEREAGPGRLAVDLGSLPRGVYFVKLRAGNGSAMQRIVIVR